MRGIHETGNRMNVRSAMTQQKMRVAIIGSGNIGADLLVKIQRSPFLECSLFAGRNLDSPGMRFAASLGTCISDLSIQAIVNDPDCCEIVFDATSASIHLAHAPILKALGKFAIDLTPSKVGRMCVPVINADACLKEPNVNLVTCGGQATVPLAYAISKVHPDVKYIEVVASISSRSAGPGTRANIDEFTQTTKDAILHFTGVPKAKTIIILNPAEPSILMRNTVYAIIPNPNMDALRQAVKQMEKQIQCYVPGYQVIMDPIFENGRVTTMVQVTGLGDYLPPYSGNLDIITCAAVHIAEMFANKREGCTHE
jgi:acetaldehyde dehydrogenase (acetylating)